MGFLTNLFGIPSKNRFNRPFYKNSTREEYLEWFENVPPWNSIDKKILDMIITKYDSNPMFEVFMYVSMNGHLIHKYAELKRLIKVDAEVAILPNIAGILAVFGTECGNRLFECVRLGCEEAEIKENYRNSMDACESAVEIEPNLIVSYIQLAKNKILFSKYDEAREYALKGINIANELMKLPMPQNMKEEVANSEKLLDYLVVEINKMS